jgi:hypothetical protein
MKRTLGYAFMSSLLVAVSYGLYAGRHWNAKTALFPRAVGFPMAGLLAVILVMEVAKGRRRTERGGDGEGVDSDAEFRATSSRMLRYFGWLFGFVGAIWAIGMSYSIPIYILAYMRVEGRYGWGKCVAYAAATAGLITVVYNYAFRVAWPEGALLRGLGL